MNEDLLRKALATTPVSEYRYFEHIGSTNDEALAWLDQGAVDFSLVIAEEQTQGKGRYNRKWVTNKGAALAFSLILKTDPYPVDQLPLFAPLCGLAVHEALADLYGMDSQIKWPNDILLKRSKCCGILVEAAWQGDRLNGLVLGIGINLTHDSLPPASLQLFSAICLEDVLQHAVDRYQLLQKILLSIKKWRGRLGSRPFFEYWTQHLAFLNEQVMIVQSEKQSIIGIEKGIDDRGNLVLILESGEERAFEVGDLHLRPVSSPHEIGG